MSSAAGSPWQPGSRESSGEKQSLQPPLRALPAQEPSPHRQLLHRVPSRLHFLPFLEELGLPFPTLLCPPSCCSPSSDRCCSRHTNLHLSIPSWSCDAGPRPRQPLLSSCQFNHGERCPETIKQHQFAPGHWGFAVVTLRQQHWD